jgi:hypothetical protein
MLGILGAGMQGRPKQEENNGETGQLNFNEMALKAGQKGPGISVHGEKSFSFLTKEF